MTCAIGAYFAIQHKELLRDAVQMLFVDPETKRLTSKVKDEPCDGGRTLELVEHLVGNGENRNAIKTANRFLSECGDAPRLRWTTHEAHRRLFEWDAAAKEATKLIATDRYDADYWWWRGMDNQNAGRLASAEADFRMATALCPGCQNAVGLADVLEKQGRPCDAISPLETLNRTAFNEENDYLRKRIALLYGDDRCKSYLSAGTTKVRLSKDGHARVSVRINDQDAGTFLVDTGATSVVVSKRLAEQLGLSGPFTDIVAKTASGYVNAKLTVVDNLTVSPVSAMRVELAVIDGEDVEPLLGMSFLSRFDVSLDENELSIKAPSKK